MSESDRRAATLAAVEGFYARVRAGKVDTTPPRANRKRDPDAAPTEYMEQGRVCDWLRAAQVIYFAVPNGALLGGSPQQRQVRWRQMARVGAKAGVPDLVIASPAPLWPDARGVALEMKRAKGGTVSPEQEAWHALLRSCGWIVIVGRGADEAIVQLTKLGYGQKP